MITVKKIISASLATLLMLTAFPLTAFAEGEEPAQAIVIYEDGCCTDYILPY